MHAVGRSVVLGLVVGTSLVAGCQGSVFSLKVGDCFDGGTGEGTVTDVAMKDCAQPHEREVFATPTYTTTATTFPGEPTLETFADENCLGAFQPYVGRDYQSSELAYGYLLPSSESWATGDRVVVCVLGIEGQQLTGTMRGTGR